MGLITSGILECSYGVLCLVHILDIVSECDPDTFRFFPCDVIVLVVTAGLWLISGILILYFVFSGRVREHIKEGLDIEAVATPVVSSDEEDEEMAADDPERGETHDENGATDANNEDERGDPERATGSTAAATTTTSTATICVIPSDSNEDSGVESDETNEKLMLSIPFTPARPLGNSERGTVSYLPNGQRDWSSNR